MRDVENGDALRAKAIEQARQRLDFVRGQRRRRLIENKNARLSKQSLGDLDHLAPAKRQVADRGRQILVESNKVHRCPRPLGEAAIVDQSVAAWQRAKADILGDRELA